MFTHDDTKTDRESLASEKEMHRLHQHQPNTTIIY